MCDTSVTGARTSPRPARDLRRERRAGEPGEPADAPRGAGCDRFDGATQGIRLSRTRRATANLLDEEAHAHRVELGRGAVLELLAGLVERERRAVGPVGGHRAERVRDREHTGLHGDRILGQAVGIPAAVPALVVVQHRRLDPAQRGDLPHELRADPG